MVSLAFSSDSKRLISIVNDDNHSATIWITKSGDWTDGALEASQRGDKNPNAFSVAVGDGTFATGGKNHYMLWTPGAKRLRPKKGKFGKVGRKTLTCAATWAKRSVITGCADGSLLVWEGDKVVDSKQASKGDGVAVSIVHASSGMLFVGCSDGMISIWNSDLERKAVLNATRFPSPSLKPAIRALCFSEKKLLVGTQGSDIFELSNVDETGGSESSAVLLMRGHCADELWGLAPHPEDADKFASVGDDQTLRVWSAEKKESVSVATLPSMSRAVAWSPDGSKLACGLGGRLGGTRKRKDTAGGVIVVDAKSMEVINRASKAPEKWVADVKFSPDGSTVAAAAHDSKVWIYSASQLKATGVKLSKSSSSVNHIDFSADARYIQTNDSSYELLYYDTTTGRQI